MQEFEGVLSVNVEAPCAVDQSSGAQRRRPGMPAREKRVFLYALRCCSMRKPGDRLPRGAGFRDTAWLAAGDQPIIVLALPVFLMLEIAREVQSVETLEKPRARYAAGARRADRDRAHRPSLTFLIKAEDISRLGFLVTFGVAAW
jgi:hypothetical protein